MLKYKHFCFARKKVSLLLLPILLVSIPLFFVPLTGQQPLKLDFANSINGFNASLSFSTFLGGNYHDEGFDISVSTDGCCYVAGATKSTNFPTLNAYDSIISNESDAFVSKFSSDGALLWSTFFGGNGSDEAQDIAVASNGDCYITGFTSSYDFPTLNANDSTFDGYNDAFVAKFSANGSLLWSTYLGGNDYDRCEGVAVTNDGCCYVAGATQSADFPTLNAYDSTKVVNDTDAFITKFSANGSLLWSTFLGGNDWEFGHCIAVASDESCYLSGVTYSSNFPTLNAIDTSLGGVYDSFVSKFSSGGALQWSTYLGGGAWDNSQGIVVASNGDCYLTGYVSSSDFPTLNAFDDSFNGGTYDAFITKLSVDGLLLWSTYLGGNNNERGFDVTVATDNSCFIAGYTKSSDFPTLNAFDNTFNGYDDGFIANFNVDGSLRGSTFLGGDNNEESYGVAFSSDDCCYIIGITSSSNFPTLNAFDNTFNGYSDAFLTKFITDLTEPINPNPTIGIPAYGFLSFIIILPLIALIMRKRWG